MEKLLLLCVFSVVVGLALSPVEAFAQKETFDLVTYIPPKAWKKQLAESAIQFSQEDAAKRTYCLITLYKAVPGTANSKENFDLAWESIVKEMVTVSKAPEMQPVTIENGWETQTGLAPFESDGNKGVILLATASAADKMVNLIVLTNTDVYEKEMTAFIESVSLKKSEINATQTPIANEDNAQHPAENSVIGTWSKSGSVNPAYNDAYATSIAGYSTDQYIFNLNGTYHFISKTFGMSFPKILLVKENGTYQINGNNITITPQKSVIEAWSKKAGVDKWGSLLTSQKRTLEKVTYQFTKHYFSGIQIWNLVLQNNKATQRDGPHSSNKSFDNAWYYSPISANNLAIELPNQQKMIEAERATESVANNSAIFGTWGKSNTVSQINNRFGNYSYNKQQYTFNTDGSYSFAAKTYNEQHSETLLIKENGNFVINGNTIKITPKSSVIEAWSKKNGADNWNQLKSIQKRPLEIASYQFSVADNNLLLQTAKQTERDGRFNNGNTYTYGPPGTFTPIKLPGK